MRFLKIRYILIIFIFMFIMTACQSKGKDDSKKVDAELSTEIETNIDDNNVPADEVSVIDVDSVLYENSIQNEEPAVDLFYNENIYVFYGKQIKIFDYATKEELQTILLEGLENVNVPVIYNESNPISEETEATENNSNTYVTAFSIYNNEYYVMSATTEGAKSVHKILQFDANGVLIKEYPIQIDNMAEKIMIKNDKAIILSINIESIEETIPYYDITIYDFAEQKQSKVDINKVLAVTLTDSNKAAIARIGESGQNILLLMDLETQQIEKETEIDIGYIMDLDYQDHKLYVLTTSDVFTVDSGLTKPVASILNNYVKTTYNRKIRIYGEKLVIMHSSNHLLLYDFKLLEQKAIDSEPYTLTVLIPNNTGDELNGLLGDYVNELKKKYPNINLKSLDVMNENTYNDEYNEKVIKKLMAKDTDFDLYVMWNNDDIIKSDYYEDLSKYEQISSNFDEMLPGIKKLMSYNKKIYGVPIYISFEGFSYHSEDLNGLGVQFPDNKWTVSDFYDFAVKNKDILEKEQKPLLNFYHVLGIDTMFNTSFYVSYLQGAELSSEDLASNFELVKKMLDEKLITVNPNYTGETIIFDKYIYPLTEAEPRLAPVLPKENSRYLASVYYVAMNPSSPNKELAAELLTAFTDSEIRKKSIFQNIDIQMQNDDQLDHIEIPNIINNYTELDRFKSFKLYKELLENSDRDISFQGRAEIGYLFEDFMNGKRTAKSAADEIIQRLNMIKNE